MTRTRPHEVRLIGGRYRRSTLPVPDHPGLRPTPDRVRETLFNWLGQELAGWRCLDAFAGSGALGFEAASRGAAEVVLIERDAGQAASLQRSVRRLQADAVQVVCADALDWMARRAAAQRFDLVFIDPPYDTGLCEPALAAALPLLVPGGWAYLETPRPYEPAGERWSLHRRGRAGAVHFQLLQRRG